MTDDLSTREADRLIGHPVSAPDILQGFHLLEADAGTGKTWTIARLVLRALIERDLSIDQIAIVTFTKPAAAELRDRIARLLDDWSTARTSGDDPFLATYRPALDEQTIRTRLRLARLQLDQAPIHTIHGFCQRILTDHGLSLGLKPAGEGGPEDGRVLTDALAQWWRREISGADSTRGVLIGSHGLGFEPLKGLLRQALACPDARFVERAPADWTTLAQRMDDAVAKARNRLDQDASTLLDWLLGPTGPSGSTYRPATLHEAFAELRRWLAQWPDSVDEDARALALFDARRMAAAAKKGTTLDVLLHCELPQHIAHLNDLRIERSQLNETIAAQIRQHITDDVDRLKQDQRRFSFDDLLHRTARALDDDANARGELADRLVARYPLALIDEFQDTDPAQWTTFSRIYRPGSNGPGSTVGDSALILVGDPKQAIYSFRNADVQTYLSARQEQPTLHRLDQNQRSSARVIDAINAIHQRDQVFGMTGIDFVAARAGPRAQDLDRAAPAGMADALSLVMLPIPENGKPPGRRDLLRLSARLCAAQIHQLLSGQGGLQAADVAVLVRTIAEGRLVRQALQALRIGSVEISRDSVFASREAQDLHRILQAVAEPGDDRFVRSAMLTQLLGHDLADLDAAASGTDETVRRFDRFDACRQDWTPLGALPALRRLVLGIRRRRDALAMPDGERRMTNLLHLFDLLAASEDARESAAEAAAWLSRHIAAAQAGEDRSESTEVRLESDDRLIRIITIHRSKGLEFPVVFLPFAWAGADPLIGADLVRVTARSDGRRTITQNNRLSIMNNPGWGIAPDDELSQAAVADAIIRQQREEALRLNYVAMTRAVRHITIFWGLSTHNPPSALDWLLDPDNDQFGEPAPARKKPATEWSDTHQRVLARVRQLADQNIGIAAVSGESLLAMLSACDARAAGDHALPYREGWPIADAMQVKPVPALPAPPWRQTSFSGLMADQTLDAPANMRPDHDESVASDETIVSGDVAPGLSVRHLFQAGAKAGTCLHEMLEHTDFTRGVAIDGVSLAMRTHGLAERPGVTAPAVAQWLDQVLATNLDAGATGADWRLAGIPMADTVREFSYLLPVELLGYRCGDRAGSPRVPVTDVAGSWRPARFHERLHRSDRACEWSILVDRLEEQSAG